MKEHPPENNRLTPYCSKRGFQFRGILSRVVATRACFEAMAAGGMGNEGALAMSSLIEAKRASHDLGLVAIESQLLVLQSSIELMEGRRVDALRSLDRSLPHVLSHGSPQLQGGTCRFCSEMVLISCSWTHKLYFFNPSFFLNRCSFVSSEMPYCNGKCIQIPTH